MEAASTCCRASVPAIGFGNDTINRVINCTECRLAALPSDEALAVAAAEEVLRCDADNLSLAAQNCASRPKWMVATTRWPCKGFASSSEGRALKGNVAVGANDPPTEVTTTKQAYSSNMAAAEDGISIARSAVDPDAADGSVG